MYSGATSYPNLLHNNNDTNKNYQIQQNNRPNTSNNNNTGKDPFIQNIKNTSYNTFLNNYDQRVINGMNQATEPPQKYHFFE